MRSCKFLKVFVAGLLFTAPLAAIAWGPAGHRITGRAALEMLDETARAEVVALLESGSPSGGRQGVAAAIDEACNWPDAAREQQAWKWSAPLHYVNIPRGANEYDRQRDCRDGLCVTEGILRYADELRRPNLSAQRRWQAFAFVCHLTGDIHQPLHAGFRDDRGGNQVNIAYRGERWNLHEFWDGVLIRERMHDEDAMVEKLACPGTASGTWSLLEPADWATQSHHLARTKGYTHSHVVTEAFSDQSWHIVQAQLEHAARRLARLLNAVLGQGEVETGR